MEHLVLLPIPRPFRGEIEMLSDKVARYARIPPPHTKLIPHITLLKFSGDVDEGELARVIAATASNFCPMRATLDHFSSFRKHYIVLPVQTPFSLAQLWAELARGISSLPNYMEGEYFKENILHATVARKTSAVFDEVWPKVKCIHVREMRIPLSQVALYRRTSEEGEWELMAGFPLSG